MKSQIFAFVLFWVLGLVQTSSPVPIDESKNHCIQLHWYQEWQTLAVSKSIPLWVIQFLELCPQAVAIIEVEINATSSKPVSQHASLATSYSDAPFFQEAPNGQEPTALNSSTAALNTAQNEFIFSLVNTGAQCSLSECPASYQHHSNLQLLCTEWTVPEFGRGWQVFHYESTQEY